MSGFKQLGLTCEKCGKPFPLPQGVANWLGSLDKLDDPFPAECPVCDHRTTYPKSAVQTYEYGR